MACVMDAWTVRCGVRDCVFCGGASRSKRKSMTCFLMVGEFFEMQLGPASIIQSSDLISRVFATFACVLWTQDRKGLTASAAYQVAFSFNGLLMLWVGRALNSLSVANGNATVSKRIAIRRKCSGDGIRASLIQSSSRPLNKESGLIAQVALSITANHAKGCG